MRMRDVYEWQRALASLLLDTAVKVARNAPVTPSYVTDGAIWCYAGETITCAENADAPWSTRHIAAADERGTRFVTIDESDRESPLEINRQGRLTGEGIPDFRRLQIGIRAGSLVGSHELLAQKSLVSPRSADGDAVLQASVTRMSAGNGIAPLAILDMRLLRANPPSNRSEGDFTVIQSHRVEHVLPAYTLQIGDGIAVENYIPPISGDPNSKGVIVYDSDPGFTATRLQQTYRPRTPLDVPPTDTAWQQLVTRPLTALDLMRAANT